MHHVVIVAFDEVELLDVAGPTSVFSTASALLPASRYRITVAGPRRGLVRTSSGVGLASARRLDDVRAIDTLIVPGAFGFHFGAPEAGLVAMVRRAAKRAKRVASVCTGAFLLAEAGLLAGKRVATHWASCNAFRARYPSSQVEDDAIFVRDGAVWTSAGVTAGIDLALALVEQDHGRKRALDVARLLVVYLHRPGGQSQFSVPLRAQAAETDPLRRVVAWMQEHPAADLSVSALARRAGMSERTFARAFRRDLGATPAAHVEALRIEAARHALERTRRPAKEIARDTGFGTVETLHRAFQRVLHVTPSEYRARFQLTRVIS